MNTAILPGKKDPPRRRRPSDSPFTWGFWVALGFTVLVVLAAATARWSAPHDPLQLDLLDTLAPPSGAHLLGTDEGGRDTLSRLLWGAQTGLFGPLAVVAISLVAGVPLGLLAAGRGGIVDLAVSRMTDLVLAFPVLLLSILAVALYGAGFLTTVVALGVAFVPSVIRLTRSLASTEKNREYINAYRSLGFGPLRIYGLHILPNILGVILAHAVVHFGYALTDLAVLSFLGFGVQAPDSDWGLMVHEGQQALLQGSPWQSMISGGVIVATVLAFNVVGLRLADAVGKEDLV
ncbi:ABC transporter permease [Sphaerisporangium sp. NPDC051011]|uniref:ABC transporter permease n=1 Tax=Sphaerisporangium sp. NPDC051011 TaxID=3155792 RepID=UPI0033FE03C1